MNPQPEHVTWGAAAWAFVGAHQTELKEAAAGLTAFAGRHFWPQIKALLKKDVGAEEAKVVAALNVCNPTVKAIGLALDKALEEAVPNAGDGRYAAAAALLLHDAPQLAWAQPYAVQVLTQLCLAGKRAAAEVAQQAANKEAVPAAPPQA